MTEIALKHKKYQRVNLIIEEEDYNIVSSINDTNKTTS